MMSVNDNWSSRGLGNFRGPNNSNNMNEEGRYSQRSSMSRPSGKAIYLQRKEYAESVSKQPNNFQHRVEHLLTVELDGRQLNGVKDCVDKLRLLDAQNRVWEQEMILEVQEAHLLLLDIETKEELEALALGSITQIQAVLDSCGYNSLLLVTVQERGRMARVFMFQCEEIGAQSICKNLERVVQHRKEEVAEHLRRNRHSIKSNLENINDRERYITSPVSPREEPETHWRTQEHPTFPYSDLKRDVEIFNHIVSDLEYFMGKVSAAITSKNKGKKKRGSEMMPPPSEFVLCLQKIKYGFNLMGRVNGQISNPSAEDFVHILFSSLGFLVSHCPPDLPPSVLSPLLTETALQLMRQVVTPEEDKLWKTLGDAWNISRSRWPNGVMIPLYKPMFYDGWEAPSPVQPLSRSDSQPYRSEGPSEYLPVQRSAQCNSPAAREPVTYMRVTSHFTARNSQELSVTKGDVVQVLDQSRQWWRVRSFQNEEGYVPPNLLESLEQHRFPEQHQGQRSAPPLNRKSRPEDVRAWLEYKGFSGITVRSLGVLTGSQLLGMTRDELRTVCPEEGGRVFFHLQGVKSALALSSESGLDPYDRP